MVFVCWCGDLGQFQESLELDEFFVWDYDCERCGLVWALSGTLLYGLDMIESPETKRVIAFRYCMSVFGIKVILNEHQKEVF